MESELKVSENNFESVKVAHLTSAHPRDDTRIFLKECCSLVASGYSVSLLVADGKGDAQDSGEFARP